MVNYYLTRELRIFTGEKTVSLMNDAGKIGYPHIKE